MHPMNIGEAASAAGVTPKMIRHYESLGLIPEVNRTDAGYRLYTPREVGMLRFIRQSRDLGFPIQQIESLLALWRNEKRESREVKELARLQLAELDARRRELDEMRSSLSTLIENCAGDDDPCCAIIERLSATGMAANTPRVQNPRAALKQVKPGSSSGAPQRARAARVPAPAATSHVGLVSWSRSFAATA